MARLLASLCLLLLNSLWAGYAQTSITGRYTSEYGEEVQLCHISNNQVTGQYVGADYNGLLTLVYTNQEWQGTFVSQNGEGTVTWVLGAGQSLVGDWTFDGDGFFAPEGKDLSAGAWDLTFVDDQVDTTVCDRPSSRPNLEGTYVTNYGETLQICHPSTATSTRATLQAQYMVPDPSGEGYLYNGLVLAVYYPTERAFVGEFASQNGKGSVKWGLEMALPTGSWSASSAGIQFSEAAGEWSAVEQTSKLVDAQVCADFSTIPDIDGSFITNYDEQLDLCQPNLRNEYGIIQGQYIASGYNGATYLVYYPSEETFHGAFASQNGVGKCWFKKDPANADDLLGKWWYTSEDSSFGGDGGIVSGPWNSERTSRVPVPALCASFDNFGTYNGVYLSDYAETISLCNPSPFRGILQGEYVGQYESYNGIVWALFDFNQEKFIGGFASQNGVGDVWWSLHVNTENGIQFASLVGEWSFTTTDSDFGGTSTGWWNATSTGDALNTNVCNLFPNVWTLDGAYTAVLEGTEEAANIDICRDGGNAAWGIAQAQFESVEAVGHGLLTAIFRPSLNTYVGHYLILRYKGKPSPGRVYMWLEDGELKAKRFSVHSSETYFDWSSETIDERWWNGTRTADSSDEAVCFPFSELPKRAGTFMSNFGEEVHLCQPRGQFMQAEVQTGHSNALMYALWKPTEQRYVGTLWGREGFGTVWIAENAVTGGLIGARQVGNAYAEDIPTFAFDDAEVWELTETAELTPFTGGICDPFTDIPPLDGHYVTPFNESLHICNSNQDYGVLQAQFHNSTINGLVFAVWKPSANRYEGKIMSQKGTGSVYLMSDLEGNPKSIVGKRIYDGELVSLDAEWWTALREESEDLAPEVCEPYREFTKLNGVYETSLRDVLDLCHSYFGVLQGEYKSEEYLEEVCEVDQIGTREGGDWRPECGYQGEIILVYKPDENRYYGWASGSNGYGHYYLEANEGEMSGR